MSQKICIPACRRSASPPGAGRPGGRAACAQKFALCLVLLVGGSAHAADFKKVDSSNDLYAAWIDPRDVQRILAQQGLTNTIVQRIRRNQRADKLVVNFFVDHYGSTNARAVFISDAGIKVARSPSVAVFNQDEQAVYWMEQSDFVFANGTRLHATPGSLTNGVQGVLSDPGAQYLLVQWQSNGRTTLATVQEPLKPLMQVPSGFAMRGLFVTTNTLFIWKSPNTGPSDLMCDVYARGSESVTLLRTATFKEWGGFRDMDPNSETFLMRGPSDLFAKEYLGSLRTGKKVSLGPVKGEAVFLKGSVVKVVKEALRE